MPLLSERLLCCGVCHSNSVELISGRTAETAMLNTLQTLAGRCYSRLSGNCLGASHDVRDAFAKSYGGRSSDAQLQT